MKKQYILLILCCLAISAWAADWDGIAVPANPGAGNKWELQSDISDDFNYDAPADNKGASFDERWTEGYHSAWTGPAPGYWVDNHTFVADGKLQLIASQVDGQTITYTYDGETYTQDRTNLGCITNKTRVLYPVYVETNVKIMNSVLASDVWMLSPDDTQEIDICEAYGSDRSLSAFFAPDRLHLSHHVFIRNPFQDWQPSDAGSFYTDGSTIWREDYHRIGVYWKDPWNLEYYVDGQLVRTRSGKPEIDPVYFTNSGTQGDIIRDTRTGLSKEMDIIINAEDQTWRAARGYTPTKSELSNTENNTFKVDWIRVYKPVSGKEYVTDVEVTPATISTGVGQKRYLSVSVLPGDATVQEVDWSSNNESIVTVDSDGWITGVGEGSAYVKATSHHANNDSDLADSCEVTVVAGTVSVPVESITIVNDSIDISTNQVINLTATILPVDASDATVTWSSSEETYATVDQSGNVSALLVPGITKITAEAVGGLKDSCVVTVYEPYITWIDSTTIKNTVYTVGDDINLSCTFDAQGSTVNGQGVQFWLREVFEDWAGIGYDFSVFDATAANQATGTASASISTSGLAPTVDLDEGNFYFLWIRFTDAEGILRDVPGLSPINIQGLPAESITFTPESTTLYYDSTMQLSATVLPANSSQKVIWKSSNNGIVSVIDSISGLIGGAEEGTATITVKSVDGNYTASANITVERYVKESAINEIDKSNVVEIYPNPAQDILKLSGNVEAFNQLIIYNLQGSEVFNIELLSNTIDVDQLDNGIYLLELIGSENRQINRIVINR